MSQMINTKVNKNKADTHCTKRASVTKKVQKVRVSPNRCNTCSGN
jgi:hypothetical protein